MSLKADRMRSRSFLGRWRGENILKEGIACAKALRFESSSNEENVSFAIHAEPKPASCLMESLSWGVIRVENKSTASQFVAWLRKLMQNNFILKNRHRKDLNQ